MTCPLCDSDRQMRKAKPLYGKMVCKKCYYKFTNRRQFAYLIDIVIWQPLAWVAGFPFGLTLDMLLPGISPLQLYWAGTAFGYLLFLIFACKDGFSGQSIGKMITGVQVVDEGTLTPIGFGQSFKRNLCLAIPFVPLIVLIQMSRGPRMGDRWAGSRVIWKQFRDHPVFTGAPLVIEPDAEFMPGDGQAPETDDNPFAPPPL